MILAVAAEQLPQVYKQVDGLCCVTSIDYWYDEPLTSNVIEQDVTPAAKVKGGMTLVEQILHHAHRKDGVSRKDLKEIATQYGFNVRSISPTLAKLTKEKRIVRTGKGVYGIPAAGRNLVKK